MKKIIFLIIAALLVIGLVLPGCSETPPEEGFVGYIKIAVAGPLSFIQGRDHVAGAELARDEINTAGGVDVGGDAYGIELVEVETNEILDTSGATGQTALTAVIDDVDFVVGGFRTEAVTVYREVVVGPDGADKIFIDDGAASNELQESVLADYDNYKYWFKGTPYNGSFLFINMLKQVGSINAQLRAAAGLTGGDPALTCGVIVEDAEWTGGFKALLGPYLGIVVGLNVCAPVQLPASTATSLETELTAISSACGGDPAITVTVLSGPPGKAYGLQQATYLPNTFTAGINVEAQDIDYHHDTGAQYHCEMDTWAEDVALTATTVDWFDDYVAETGRYPSYCAATYDSIKALMLAVEDVGGFDATYTDDIIAWFEDLDNAYTGTASTTGYYPMPDLGPFAAQGPSAEQPTGYSGEWYALSVDQAYAIHGDGLLTYYGAKYGIADYAELAGNWTSGYNIVDAWGASVHVTPADSTGKFLPHDTIYGPGWQTGQGAQWQPIDPDHPELDWHKVGWWPMVATSYGANTPAADLTPTDAAILYGAGLLDQYGNWNFAYSGSVPLMIPQTWIDYWSP